MEVLNARHEIRATSLDISCAFNTAWHHALLTKLSSYGIQGNLHSWLADFLSCRSHRVALNGVLSSPPFLSRLELFKAVFWALFFFWFSSMISLTLWKTLYLIPDDCTLCHTIYHLLGKQQTLPLCIKKMHKQIPATTDQSAFSQSSARLRNPSSLPTLNP